MKKFTALLLAVAFIVAFAACGDDSGGDTDPVSSDSDSSDGAITPSEIFGRIESAGSPQLPMMMDINESRLADYNVNPDDAVSYVAKEAAISAIFIQIIIIEAKDGKVSDVNDAMLEHQSTLKDSAFYPQGAAAAAASIVGVKDNFVYLICDENAQEIEELLLNFIA